jgi:uncharacterized tellurite resistance protein B-like protein
MTQHIPEKPMDEETPSRRTEHPLEFDATGAPTNRELQIIALCALVAAARADEDFAGDELTQVVDGLTRRFNISDAEVGELISVAELLVRDPVKTSSLLTRANERFSPEQRIEILTMVWRVVASDRRASSKEARYAVELRRALDLTLEQSALAARKAEEEMDTFRFNLARKEESNEG